MLYIIAFYSAFNLSHLVKCYLCRKLLLLLSFKHGSNAKWWGFLMVISYTTCFTILIYFSAHLGISMCSMATEEVENTAALYPSLPNFFTKWKRAKHEWNSQLSCHNYFILFSINSNLSSQRKKSPLKSFVDIQGSRTDFAFPSLFFTNFMFH